jgi:hypothetical protein
MPAREAHPPPCAMAQPDAAARQRKLEAAVRAMQDMDRLLARHQKLPTARTKRKQPEHRPFSSLLTLDQRVAELTQRADRIYEEAMRELDPDEESLAHARDEHQEMELRTPPVCGD